ncbi:dTDP-4-amino-4,6-dideoxygalactose transaminase [anaerobic digester metagenome]
MINFNKPYLTGKETQYITEAVQSGKISGNGVFTQKCHGFFSSKYHFNRCLLASSCTDALEMSALLANITPGDEVIIPSFTFVSTALAFVRQGANIVFADSYSHHPNIDANTIEALITPKTKAIVPVHYAGIACDLDLIKELANKYNLLVIEDAAQAIDSFYKEKPLGGIGDLGCFSFHETKNIISGEGGMLTINNSIFEKRAEIIWEKGTNRSEFFRGEVNKYGWVDIGSSFLPSEITAAFLFAQLEHVDLIQQKRKEIWNLYNVNLSDLALKEYLELPQIPSYATNNAHMFYLVCRNAEERSWLIRYLKDNGVMSVFHYQSLHKSPYYAQRHDGRSLPNSDRFTDCLLRLPIYFELSLDDVNLISTHIVDFYKKLHE